jgi:hypothetical protein
MKVLDEINKSFFREMLAQNPDDIVLRHGSRMRK